MSMLKEFKDFAMRGNVVDMAVGIIIGAGFGKIINSVVNDVIMPPIGLALGGVDFSALAVNLRDPVEGAGGVAIKYGVFINTVLDFTIVAFCVFALIRAMNSLKRKDVAPATAPTTKDCPRCCSSIAIKASRCPNCTSELQAA